MKNALDRISADIVDAAQDGIGALSGIPAIITAPMAEGRTVEGEAKRFALSFTRFLGDNLVLAGGGLVFGMLTSGDENRWLNRGAYVLGSMLAPVIVVNVARGVL